MNAFSDLSLYTDVAVTVATADSAAVAVAVYTVDATIVVVVVTITVGVVSVAVGIGLPVFYESQIDNAVYINDHGLVKKYRDLQTHRHIPYRLVSSLFQDIKVHYLSENLSKTKHVVLRFIILDQQYSKTSSSDLEKSLWNLNPTFCMNQNIESMFGLSDEDIISTFWSRIMREEAKILVEEETTTTTTNTILSGEMEFMYKRLEHEAEEKVQALKEIRETVNHRNHIDGSVKLIGTSLFS
ncbi:uncharacterized protein LOC127747693 [Arachis duranensis]|uniref:Uncharacterized protein LOC127747693 n=1 Tax=Arachis duranensis TaxID=130453 RepID=A0A9C6TPM2_ARADU|nr:uncharacterized protein LOC127747693 [Arachis duranensis]